MNATPDPMLLLIRIKPRKGDLPEARSIYVHATSTKEAIRWLLDNDERFADPGGIIIEQLPALIDLVATPKAATASTATPEPAPEAPKARRRGGRVKENDDPDQLTVPQVMELTGLDARGVHNRTYSGKFTRISYGHVTRASVEAWLAKGGLQGEKRSGEAMNALMNAARAAKRVKADAARAQSSGKEDVPVIPMPKKPLPPSPGGEDFVQEEHLAKDLNMHLELLQSIKRRGNIAGGYGWIDRKALAAYMESDEYRELL